MNTSSEQTKSNLEKKQISQTITNHTGITEIEFFNDKNIKKIEKKFHTDGFLKCFSVRNTDNNLYTGKYQLFSANKIFTFEIRTKSNPTDIISNLTKETFTKICEKLEKTDIVIKNTINDVKLGNVNKYNVRDSVISNKFLQNLINQKV